MSELQIDPQAVIQQLINEVTRLTLDLAIARAIVEAKNSPIHVLPDTEE